MFCVSGQMLLSVWKTSSSAALSPSVTTQSGPISAPVTMVTALNKPKRFCSPNWEANPNLLTAVRPHSPGRHMQPQLWSWVSTICPLCVSSSQKTIQPCNSDTLSAKLADFLNVNSRHKKNRPSQTLGTHKTSFGLERNTQVVCWKDAVEAHG